MHWELTLYPSSFGLKKLTHEDKASKHRPITLLFTSEPEAKREMQRQVETGDCWFAKLERI